MNAVAAVRPPVEEPPPPSGPRFRDDVELLSLESWEGGPTRWYARQPENRELFELGREGAFLCRHLDGRTSLVELRRRLEEELGTSAEEDDVEVFLEQLARSGLLEGTAPQRGPSTLPEIFDPEIFIPRARIHLGRGDRLAAFFARRLRFAFSRPFHLLALGAIGWALVVFAQRFGDLGAALSVALSPGFVLLVAAASSLLVQSPRSLVHGMLCKRYGRQVTEMSVALIYYFLPAVFLDWSDLAWVRQRNKRFWAIFSGIYYQAVLWSVALLAWHLTRPGSVANTAWLAVAVAAGLGLLLFNANPLVKMDGYLLLVNWTEIPRLRERSLAAFGALATGRRRPEVLTRRERRWFVLYGLLCSTYAVFHFSLLFWGVWQFLIDGLRGSGALMTLALALFAVHRPLGYFMSKRRSVRWLFLEGGPVRRWGVRVILLAVLGALMFVPYPYETSGPVTLLPASRYEIRPEVEGMVEQVLVDEGERVEVGQPILQLVRRVHEGRLQAAEAQLAEKQAELRLAQKGATVEEIAAAEQRVATARAQLGWSVTRADRYEALFRDALISQQEYENALQVRDVDREELAEAEADLRYVQRDVRSEIVEALEAELRTLQVVVGNYQGDVERTVVTTPFAGVVSTPRVRELTGRYVKPGQREVAIEIQELDHLRAEVQIREQDLGAVRPGARVRVVTWPYPDQIFVGTVTAIAPVATTETKLVVDQAGVALGEPDEKVVRVTMELPNPAGLLRPELTGYAKIQVEDRPVGDVLFRPFIRWCKVEVWSWIP